MSRYFSAELLRARGSAMLWLPLLALPVVILNFLLSWGVDGRRGIDSVLSWQGFFLTGLAAPVAALFAGVAEEREKRARYGATRWRPISHRRQRAARLGVVLLSLFAFHLVMFSLAWVFTWRWGFSGSWRVLLLGLAAYIGAVGIAGLAAGLARVTNLVVTVATFLVWQLVGINSSVVEGEMWWAWPMVWPIRLVLPVMEVHQNLLPLEAGAPLWETNLWLVGCLCVLLAVVGAAVAVATPEDIRISFRLDRRYTGKVLVKPGDSRRRAVVTRAAAGRPRPFTAMTRVSLGAPLVACLALSCAAMLYLALVYPPATLHGFFTFAVLPLGAGLLALLVWHRVSQAWSLMRIHYPGCERVVLIWSLAVVVLVSCTAGVLGLVAGGGLAEETRRTLLAVLVGYLLVLVSYQLVVRWGAAVSIAGVLLIALYSVLVGGDVLADTPLWVVGVGAWPNVAHSGARFGIASVIGSMAVVFLHVSTSRLLVRRTH